LQQFTGTLGRAKRGHLQRAQRAPGSRRQAACCIYATPHMLCQSFYLTQDIVGRAKRGVTFMSQSSFIYTKASYTVRYN